jgi:tetratricopeptide (TPR) repeat protein
LLDEAITQLLHATKLDPRNAYNHSTLGLAYFGKGLLDEAIAQMKLATQLEQPNWLYHSNLGDVYFEKNMWDESIEEYKRVIELGSESAAIYNNLGTAYAAKDLWREAIKEFERAIQMDPTLDLAQENFIIAQKNMVLAKSRKPSRAKKQESPSMFHKTKAYVQLDRLENELRSFIQQKMEQTFGKYWWKQRIPSDIQEKCWERKLKREAIPWQEVKKLHPIYYADFPHYLLIITRRDNWNRVFKSYFYSETWIKSKLEELNVIRTDISHTRTKMLTPRDARILEIYAEDILHSIQRSGPHREAESS